MGVWRQGPNGILTEETGEKKQYRSDVWGVGGLVERGSWKLEKH
jgi:hypothetical protein